MLLTLRTWITWIGSLPLDKSLDYLKRSWCSPGLPLTRIRQTADSITIQVPVVSLEINLRLVTTRKLTSCLPQTQRTILTWAVMGKETTMTSQTICISKANSRLRQSRRLLSIHKYNNKIPSYSQTSTKVQLPSKSSIIPKEGLQLDKTQLT